MPPSSVRVRSTIERSNETSFLIGVRPTLGRPYEELLFIYFKLINNIFKY